MTLNKNVTAVLEEWCDCAVDPDKCPVHSEESDNQTPWEIAQREQAQGAVAAAIQCSLDGG